MTYVIAQQLAHFIDECGLSSPARSFGIVKVGGSSPSFPTSEKPFGSRFPKGFVYSAGRFGRRCTANVLPIVRVTAKER